MQKRSRDHHSLQFSDALNTPSNACRVELCAAKTYIFELWLCNLTSSNSMQVTQGFLQQFCLNHCFCVNNVPAQVMQWYRRNMQLKIKNNRLDFHLANITEGHRSLYVKIRPLASYCVVSLQSSFIQNKLKLRYTLLQVTIKPTSNLFFRDHINCYALALSVFFFSYPSLTVQ